MTTLSDAPKTSIVVLLLRHAQSVENVDGELDQTLDSPLTAVGRAQANTLVVALSQVSVSAIYSSDTVRARDTIGLLAESKSLIPICTPLLREPTRARAARYLSIEQASSLIDSLTSMPSAPPKPETHAALIARLRKFLTDVFADRTPRTVVVCSHFVTLNVLSRLLTLSIDPPPGLWAQFDNASVTRIDVPADSTTYVGTLKFLNRHTD